MHGGHRKGQAPPPTHYVGDTKFSLKNIHESKKIIFFCKFLLKMYCRYVKLEIIIRGGIVQMLFFNKNIVKLMLQIIIILKNLFFEIYEQKQYFY